MGKSKVKSSSFMGPTPPCKPNQCPIYPGDRGNKGATGPYGGGDGKMETLVDVNGSVAQEEGAVLGWQMETNGFGAWGNQGGVFPLGLKAVPITTADYFAGGVSIGYNTPAVWAAPHVAAGAGSAISGAGVGLGIALGLNAQATPTANPSFAIGKDVSAAEGVAVPAIENVPYSGLTRSASGYKVAPGTYNALFQDATGLLVQLPITLS